MGIIKDDPVLKKYYFTYWNALISHLAASVETDAQQRAMRYQLEYIYNQIAIDYFEKLVNELENSLNNGDIAELESEIPVCKFNFRFC
jgi:predicted metal-dependent hydrolase